MAMNKFDKDLARQYINWLLDERDRQHDQIRNLETRIDRILTHFGLVEHRVNETTLIKK